jgi:hypothetical protein
VALRNRLTGLMEERLRLLIQRTRTEAVRATSPPATRKSYDQILAQIDRELAVIEARLELIANAKGP